jgi:hypothetical protein
MGLENHNSNTLNFELTQSHHKNENSAKINSVQLNNSSQIQLGPRLIYNGPVTITNSIHNDENSAAAVAAVDCCCFEISRKTLKRVLTSLAIILIVVLLFALVLLAFFLSNAHDNKKENAQPEMKLKSPPNLGVYRYYTREDWNATMVEPYDQLVHPIKRVIINHTVMRGCYTERECILILQQIQKLHIGFDFGDIGYNFVVMNDGSIFEGRGWNTMGAHTRGSEG